MNLAVQFVPLDCWTCKYKKQEEHGPALAVGITEQHCSKFLRWDHTGKTTILCIEAYDDFCGGGDWSPTFWVRIIRWFNRNKRVS